MFAEIKVVYPNTEEMFAVDDQYELDELMTQLMMSPEVISATVSRV